METPAMKQVSEKRTRGVAIGAAGAALWFAPWGQLQVLGVPFVQSGQQIGGSTYLVIAAFIAYVLFSWQNESRLQLVAGGAALAAAGFQVNNLADYGAWGLWLTLLVAMMAMLDSLDNFRKINKVS